MLQSYLPILVLLCVAGALSVALLFAARALGPRRPSREKSIPYESGMDPASEPRIRFNAQFYRVALLFLVFDIEAAFFYPWAVMFRDLSCRGSMQDGICHGEVTVFGLLVMVVFLAVLLLGLAFVWKKGALQWGHVDSRTV